MTVRGPSAQKAGKILVISADPEIARILEVNLTHAGLEVVPVRGGREALRKIPGQRPDVIILDPALPEPDYEELRRYIQSVPSDTALILLGVRQKKENEEFNAGQLPIFYIPKPFDPSEVVRIVKGQLIRQERKANIDPLTGLPNRAQITREIFRFIEAKSTFALVYVAMHDFKTVNRAYGYIQGDRIIQLLADIVSEAVRLFGNPTDLAGHFSGDKFAVISTPYKARTLCRRIIADYNRRIKVLFTGEHLQKGHAAVGKANDNEQVPIMSIHIAVVTNQKREFHHPLEVIGYAAEQLEYLKSSPESNCYFDLKINGFEPSLNLARRDEVQASREELGAVQSVLGWLDFLMAEVEKPLAGAYEALHSLESGKDQTQLDILKSLQDNYNRVSKVAVSVTDLARIGVASAGALFDEVDLGDIFDWVSGQTRPLAEDKKIKIDINIEKGAGSFIGDRRALTQSLLYLLRNEISSSPRAAELHVKIDEKNEESIVIAIINPDHYLPPRTLQAWQRGQQNNNHMESAVNEFYPGSVLLRSIGGKLKISSEKGAGTIYNVTIPKKWQSWMPEVNALQLALDISRKEARDAIKNLQRLVGSLCAETSPPVKEAYERLGSKLQELAVLGNRALFLADDYNSRLEKQQDRLLQQELEQIATSEAIVTICREMLQAMDIIRLFDLESARRVARYALSIAKEFQLPHNERQVLNHAALLKEIALAFARPAVMEAMGIKGGEANTIKNRLHLVWKALSGIPFFSPVCNLLLYLYERFDGTGGSFGLEGTSIPLGTRILAVAAAFDFLIFGRGEPGQLAPAQAIEKIVADSGRQFDPQVVSTFVAMYKRNELNAIFGELH